MFPLIVAETFARNHKLPSERENGLTNDSEEQTKQNR